MANMWLPSWARVMWAEVFAVIVVVHLWHVVVMTGRQRLWHCVHVLMALGMIVMFVPADHMVVAGEIGEIVFGLGAIAVVGLLVADLVRGRTAGRLWMVSAVDLAAMVYMFAMMTTRLAWLTVLFVTWLVLQAAGWATGWLYVTVNHGGLGAPRGASRLRRSPRSARRMLVSSPRGQPRGTPAAHSHDTSTLTHYYVICVTLTLMALGMAYMLVAMQFGMIGMGQLQSMYCSW